MVPINVQKSTRDFNAYNDIYDKLYAQRLNKEMTSWPHFWLTEVPNQAVQAYKDIYSAYQYDKDMEKQNELDALDSKLKQRELDLAEKKYQASQDMEPYRQQVLQSMKTAFDNATPEEKLEFLPYMNLGGIYGY